MGTGDFVRVLSIKVNFYESDKQPVSLEMWTWHVGLVRLGTVDYDDILLTRQQVDGFGAG